MLRAIKLTQRSLIIAFSLACLPTKSQADSVSDPAFLKDLGRLGGDYSTPYGMNAYGNIVVGEASIASLAPRAFIWRASTGQMISLGTLGGNSSIAYAVSAAGDVVVGNSSTASIFVGRAFIWRASTNQMQDLGTFGGLGSGARAVNAAGDVVVGYADTPNDNINHAFRWTAASNQMLSLGTLGGNTSYAMGVNAAGDVVVGAADTAGNLSHAFRWTLASNQMTDLGTLGGSTSSATAVNAAGDVIAGNSANSSNATHAFRWTASNGQMTDLGTLGGGASYVNAINSIGNVVVGNSLTSSGAMTGFRWTTTGMQSISDWLAEYGVSLGSVHIESATGTDATGNVVIGALSNGNAYLARGLASGAGLIDLPSFNRGLASVANSTGLASNEVELVINGMHSNPMRTLLSDGQTSFYAGGDAGRKAGDGYNTNLMVGEVSLGHRFNDTWQLNVSAGQMSNAVTTDLGGKTASQTTYFMPQFILTLPTDLYASIDLFYGIGNMNIRRSYWNAGTYELAAGKPNTTSMGGRLRFDWLNLVSFADINITPYASLTRVQTKTNAYSEQGVAFPVHWDSRTDSATTLHAGLDGNFLLSENYTLLGKAEVAHRLESKTAAVSGQIEGLNNFAFDGSTIKQNWIRVGTGAEINTGSGLVSVMFNTTISGDAPSYWISANYRWNF